MVLLAAGFWRARLAYSIVCPTEKPLVSGFSDWMLARITKMVALE